MTRTLSLYNIDTGETADVRDVSGLDKLKIFSMKFQMMCDTNEPWIVADSAERDQQAMKHRAASPNEMSQSAEGHARA